MKAIKAETTTVEEKKQRYNKYKEMHSNMLWLFVCGGWYEAYAEDAHVVADVLNIVVTMQKDLHIAAFPHTALDAYLPRLIRAGYRVAIMEAKDESNIPNNETDERRGGTCYIRLLSQEGNRGALQ